MPIEFLCEDERADDGVHHLGRWGLDERGRGAQSARSERLDSATDSVETDQRLQKQVATIDVQPPFV